MIFVKDLSPDELAEHEENGFRSVSHLPEFFSTSRVAEYLLPILDHGATIKEVADRFGVRRGAVTEKWKLATQRLRAEASGKMRPRFTARGAELDRNKRLAPLTLLTMRECMPRAFGWRLSNDPDDRPEPSPVAIDDEAFARINEAIARLTGPRYPAIVRGHESDVFRCLRSKELLVLKRVFGFDGEKQHTLRDAGARFAPTLSPERVRQIRNRSLFKLSIQQKSLLEAADVEGG